MSAHVCYLCTKSVHAEGALLGAAAGGAVGATVGNKKDQQYNNGY